MKRVLNAIICHSCEESSKCHNMPQLWRVLNAIICHSCEESSKCHNMPQLWMLSLTGFLVIKTKCVGTTIRTVSHRHAPACSMHSEYLNIVLIVLELRLTSGSKPAGSNPDTSTCLECVLNESVRKCKATTSSSFYLHQHIYIYIYTTH